MFLPSNFQNKSQQNFHNLGFYHPEPDMWLRSSGPRLKSFFFFGWVKSDDQLKMTLWAHFWFTIAVSTKPTQHIAFPVTSLLQNKPQLAFYQLKAFNVKLQQQDVLSLFWSKAQWENKTATLLKISNHSVSQVLSLQLPSPSQVQISGWRILQHHEERARFR